MANSSKSISAWPFTDSMYVSMLLDATHAPIPPDPRLTTTCCAPPRGGNASFSQSSIKDAKFRLLPVYASSEFEPPISSVVVGSPRTSFRKNCCRRHTFPTTLRVFRSICCETYTVHSCSQRAVRLTLAAAFSSAVQNPHVMNGDVDRAVETTSICDCCCCGGAGGQTTGGDSGGGGGGHFAVTSAGGGGGHEGCAGQIGQFVMVECAVWSSSVNPAVTSPALRSSALD